MIPGLDSAYPPTSANVAAAYKSGIRVWAGYFAGINILNGWSKAAFDAVKAGGMTTLAYCSGWSNPISMRQQSDDWGVPICLDVEGGIRADGQWVQGWLNTAQSGLYGNIGVFKARRAAFYVLAAYPGYDPQATWPSPTLRPPDGPYGWQWKGSHPAFGRTVDSSWLDDEFGGAQGGVIGGRDLDTEEHDWLSENHGRILPILNAVNALTTSVADLTKKVDALKPGAPAVVDAAALAKAVNDEMSRRLQG